MQAGGDSEVKQWEVVTICGSMRFYEDMLNLATVFTTEGFLVYMPFSVKGGNEKHNTMLDQMHREKIRLSSRIAVVTNRQWYIGQSTRGEMEYAESIGVPTRYFAISDVTTPEDADSPAPNMNRKAFRQVVTNKLNEAGGEGQDALVTENPELFFKLVEDVVKAADEYYDGSGG